MDPVQRIRKLREGYERALDVAEARRAAYHEAVIDLIEHGEPHLRELAEELGVLDHPEHPAVRKPQRRRVLARVAGGVLGVLVLAAATLGGLRLAHAPPFVSYVRVPRVLGMAETAAIRRVRDAGLNAQVVLARRSVPRSLSHHVVGVTGTPGERLARGSTVTLYVVISRTAHRRAKSKP